MKGKWDRDTVTFTEFTFALGTTGDLEPGTLVVSGNAQPANPQYSFTTFACIKPTETWIQVLRLCARFTLTVSLITAPATLINYCVSVDDVTGLIAARKMMTGSFNTAAANAVSEDIHAGNKPTVFDLLNDGLNHRIDIFLWTDNVAGSVSVTLAQVTCQCGSNNTGASSSSAVECLKVTRPNARVSFSMAITRIGTGNIGITIYYTPKGVSFEPAKIGRRAYSLAAIAGPSLTHITNIGLPVSNAISICLFGNTVATDADYLSIVGICILE